MTARWLWGLVVGIAVSSACSSSNHRSTDTPTDITIIRGSSGGTGGSSGTAGTPESSDAGGAAGSGDAGGAAGSDEPASAGAGGADPCAGNYECLLPLYWSHAVIQVDLPISVAEAADAVFTVCRNDECYSAPGGAKVDDAWVPTREGGTVSLAFDVSRATPSALVDWKFLLDAPIESDRYSIAVQPLAAAAPSTLFDATVKYTTTVADPSSVSEGYCFHCSEVSIATVDARAGG